METIDPKQAARVWSRVRGQTQDEDEETLTLEELISREWEDAALYLQLFHRTGGREAAQFQRLHQQKQAHCACLRGIYRMLTGDVPRLQKLQPAREPLEPTLRRCYERELQSLCAFQQRSEDPNYGHVYARMAQQTQEHCRTILELIGTLANK